VSAGAAEARRPRWRDPRLAIGLAITAVTLWFSLRDVSYAQIGRAMARADLLVLLLPSVPAYVWSLWIRAQRWRHLVGAVAQARAVPLFRATAVGFMANNVFPLRIGEVVRAWYLARDLQTSGAAIFGTVIVERVIDAACVLALFALVVGTVGAQAAGIDPGPVLFGLGLGGVALPFGFIVLLRVAPEAAVGLATRVAGAVLPQRLTERLHHLLSQLAGGLGGLRGPGALAWVLLHSVLLWGVASWIPFYAALRAMGMELGPVGMVEAAYALLVWVGLAVALPSAPGFFGPYHAACWVALRPFGVAKEEAVALGTLSHVVFWLTMTATGLVVLRLRGDRLRTADPASVEPPPAPR
jgi:uncharacterized protein (TIRG00374 family)